MIAAICVALLAACALLWQRMALRRTMRRLNDMLDAAINGDFTEQSFDESLLSATENKLAGYLSASEVSARNLAREKHKIKELISDISHQTKTPIANILLYAQLLAEQDLPGQSAGCVAALNSQAEKLSFLIASLMKLSRLETGMLSLCPSTGSIAPLLDDVLGQFAPRAAEKGIDLHAAPTGESAVFDPKWTAEALANLMDNAVKYTPGGGSVFVGVTAYDLFCRIDVTDTGMGIPEAEQARVFGRFYRSPSASGQEGVGIGLYLARRIVEQQGGYIKVGPGQAGGSTFSVFLPRER